MREPRGKAFGIPPRSHLQDVEDRRFPGCNVAPREVHAVGREEVLGGLKPVQEPGTREDKVLLNPPHVIRVPDLHRPLEDRPGAADLSQKQRSISREEKGRRGQRSFLSTCPKDGPGREEGRGGKGQSPLACRRISGLQKRSVATVSRFSACRAARSLLVSDACLAADISRCNSACESTPSTAPEEEEKEMTAVEEEEAKGGRGEGG